MTFPISQPASRTALLALMQRYSELSYRLTLLEVDKLAYLLQQAGEPLGLDFEAGEYGPHAPELERWIASWDGSFLSTYGAGQPDQEIVLLPSVAETVCSELEQETSTLERYERVVDLIDGFETPYGQELLATVHWLANHSEAPTVDPDTIVAAFRSWNGRKRDMFKAEHIVTGLARLVERGWAPRNSSRLVREV